MAYIKLTKGKQTLVDDSLYEQLNTVKWYASGRQFRPARRLSNLPHRPLVYMYHEILGVYPWQLGSLVVDHINNNPLDNRLANLRLVTQQENCLNGERHLNQVGISVDRTHNTFKAYWKVPYEKRVNIGTYKTRELAKKALANYKGGLS